MCGVIGLIYTRDKQDLGETACKLLQMLEYRGYDSTGAVIQDTRDHITLLKDVGAPSQIAFKLGINKLSGQVFCGQVRWATFGVVTRENAQPHEVKCKTHIYGAHNGNITNCSQLKEWLFAEGHDVKSDNDGEMLIHTIEHFFALELQFKDAANPAVREKAMRNAIIKAGKKAVGSFAAIVVDPVTRVVTAIKAGSSLYLGRGSDPIGGDFVIASSDLASVLQLTRILIPIKEKEFAVFSPNQFDLFDLRTGKKLIRHPQRSLLRAEETRLAPPFRYFMEQEIDSQVQASRRLITLFHGGNAVTRLLREHLKTHRALFLEIQSAITALAEITEKPLLREKCGEFFASPAIKKFIVLIESSEHGSVDFALESNYATFLEEIRELAAIKAPIFPVLMKFIDAIFELDAGTELENRVKKFVQIVGKARKAGKTIFILACGTSYHAGKTAPIFFDEIAGTKTTVLLPGEFRAQCTHSIQAGDVVIGISQSGETKDLIDVFSFLERNQRSVKRICILNNTNSTLALEKSDLFIPLFCGPEIAVPATKSFLNQLLVLYILAVRLKQDLKRQSASAAAKDEHLAALLRIPELLDKTLKTTQKETDDVAADLFLQPSMHILATRYLGIAKEGALKIREVVLNHTEGFEGSEFKHGPNTILGVNTVFGLDSIRAILRTFSHAVLNALESPEGRVLDGLATQSLFKAAADYAFDDILPRFLDPRLMTLFNNLFQQHNFFDSMYSNYPLVFICGPNETDINLTISQINTHKIRGADVYMIAEDNDMLREAVATPPGGNTPYRHHFVTLPRTENPLMTIFSITLVLQVLALKMSVKKMEFLDRLEITGHGVHPDVPKNVSKSITVD
jgi:glucosamine 6-phosphate synthetase-like amidotransferase/phosphosugar isomerase protein